MVVPDAAVCVFPTSGAAQTVEEIKHKPAMAHPIRCFNTEPSSAAFLELIRLCLHPAILPAWQTE